MKKYRFILLGGLFLGACSGSDGVSELIKTFVCGDGGGSNQSKMVLEVNPEIASNLGTLLNAGFKAVGMDASSLSVKSEAASSTNPDIQILSFEGSLKNAAGWLFKGANQKVQSDGSLKGILNAFLSQGATSLNMNLTSMNAQDSSIQKALPVYSVKVGAVSYESYTTQWAIKQVEAQGKSLKEVYKILFPQEDFSKISRKIKVAVIDTGVDLNHPDLKKILSSKGKSFVKGEDSPQDENGHGTHCAGIIASQKTTDKSPLGIAGPLAAAEKLEILPIKVLGKSGGGDSAGVTQGILYAIEQGADVISMSLGGGGDYADLKKDTLIDPAIDKAVKAGVLVIVAAGNEGSPLGGETSQSALFGLSETKIKNYIVHPCSFQSTICIGSVEPDESLAKYSNYSGVSGTESVLPGEYFDGDDGKSGTADDYRIRATVNAPGSRIYSTWPVSLGDKTGYNTISGTSMATPFVAGMAAVMKAYALSQGKEYKQEDFRKDLQKALIESKDALKKSRTGRVDFLKLAYVVKGDVLEANKINEEKNVENEAPKPTEGSTELGIFDMLCGG